MYRFLSNLCLHYNYVYKFMPLGYCGDINNLEWRTPICAATFILKMIKQLNKPEILFSGQPGTFSWTTWDYFLDSFRLFHGQSDCF